ncbi:histidine phosphatase superfamily [Powellomyces hirtus]|nr:histidine phosphatase superfamily [Powellomyces hirtus]
MKSTSLAVFALCAAAGVQAGPLEQFATPVVDDHLPVLGSASAGQDLKLSTKSRYNIPDGVGLPPVASTSAPEKAASSRCGNPSTPSTCKVIQIQLVARHGTRNPTQSNLKKHAALKKDFASYIAPAPQYQFLSNFSLMCNTSMAGMLTTQGALDQLQLAQRLKARYPTLLNDASQFSWQATNISRTISSGEAFQKGMLSNAAELVAARKQIEASVLPEHIDSDLRPHDSCKKNVDERERREKAGEEPGEDFVKLRFPAIRDRLAAHIGFPNLSLADVEQMFSLCSFENTIQGKNDGFCSLFSAEELELSNYGSDLAFWFERSYGMPVAEQMGCSLLTTVTTNMDKKINGSSDALNAHFKFGHAETLAPLLTTLGLFRDTLAANFTDAQIASRVFRAADFAPFSANVLFELSECPPTANSTTTNPSLSIRIFSDETPVTLPGCTDPCPLDQFKSLVAGKIGCDFDGAVCNNTRPTVGGSATLRSKSQLTDADATPSEDDAD